jgi:type II secretory pathway predicted ATPase ExeA
MYCDYWNLKKPPFDNVPDPSMYAGCHTSMENVVSETIFAIREANEAFAVIIGAVGLGKTLSLRIIIDSLEPEKYKVVLITNPSLSFTQLLREIIGQITGEQCEENRKVDLLEIFNHLLFQTMDQGRKIVIFIDEANAISPANLENLRLLTNMQDDQRNLFTLVLAGQLELAERLEHPKRANLFQRIGTYGRIDKLPSAEAVTSYIETRLQLAGTKIKIFSEDCIPVIWEYSEQGVPRLINKLCKLCLKAGETNKLDYIRGDIVLQIAQRFQKLSKTAVQKRKPRVRPDVEDVTPATPLSLSMADLSEIASSFDESPTLNIAQQANGNVILFPVPTDTDIPEEKQFLELPVTEHMPPPEAALQAMEIAVPEVSEQQTTSESESAVPLDSERIACQELVPELPALEITADCTIDESLLKPDEEVSVQNTRSEEVSPEPAKDITVIADEVHDIPQDHPKSEKPARTPDLTDDEVIIGEYRIQLGIPRDILKQVKSFNRDSANKSAGFWAAQIIKKNPQLTRSPQADPVHIWNEIKDNILKKIAV